MSKSKRVGVDIEEVRPTVGRVQHKFVGESEELLNIQYSMFNELVLEGEDVVGEAVVSLPNGFEKDLQFLTLLWSCKEAVYKWYGWGEVDFKDHIVVQGLKQLSAADFESEVCFQKNEPVMLRLCSKYFKELVLSYVVSDSGESTESPEV